MKSKTGYYFRKALVRKMSPLEIERIKSLLCYVQRFHRLKFENDVPSEYMESERKLDSLLPIEFRQSNYLGFGISAPVVSLEYVSFLITSALSYAARKTLSNDTRAILQGVIDSNLYELPDMPDVSSCTSSDSNPQEVPVYSDDLEPKLKMAKKE